MEELEISCVAYNKLIKLYMKACMKILPKGPTKKAIKTNAKKFADKKEEGYFYNYCKQNADNLTFYARQGTETQALKGEAAIVVADMTDWKNPTFFYFGPGLEGKSC